MSNGLAEKARQRIIGRTPDWVKKFDLNEYVKNPPMIEKFYEEKQLALVTSFDLEENVNSLSVKVHNLK